LPFGKSNLQVKAIYINTFRYDVEAAKTCIASIRYWYPEIPIYLIKDFGAGPVDSKIIERIFKVGILGLDRRRLGWGFGKLEPLFLNPQHSFLILDPDTVFTGKVLDRVKDIDAPFIIDEEIPEINRFNEIYYNLGRIPEIAPEFIFPGYSFNSGQWFGTSNIIQRKDFDLILNWTEPPTVKYADMFYNGEQGMLNFTFHRMEQQNKIKIHRMPLMIYPAANNAEFIRLSALEQKKNDHPYIIHWAGMKKDSGTGLPRQDILDFYGQYYYRHAGKASKARDLIKNFYLKYEKRLKQ
jgi:hypothetical protein